MTFSTTSVKPSCVKPFKDPWRGNWEPVRYLSHNKRVSFYLLYKPSKFVYGIFLHPVYIYIYMHDERFPKMIMDAGMERSKQRGRPRRLTSRKTLVPAGDRARARCVTGAHVIAYSTAADIVYFFSKFTFKPMFLLVFMRISVFSLTVCKFSLNILT